MKQKKINNWEVQFVDEMCDYIDLCNMDEVIKFVKWQRKELIREIIKQVLKEMKQEERSFEKLWKNRIK